MAYLLTELKRHLMLEHLLARKDQLTGLWNRSAFNEQTHAFFSAAARYRQSLTLAYIDLDSFKAANDTMGHAEGDSILKTVGETLCYCARDSDIAARLGGDEFAVFLPNANLAGAQAFFNRLHRLLLNKMKKKGWTRIGFSIGVAVFGKGTVNVAEALKQADALMYRVKKEGRNRVLYQEFTGGDLEDTAGRLETARMTDHEIGL